MGIAASSIPRKRMSAMPEAVKDAAYWTEAALETWARFMRRNESPDGFPDHVAMLETFSGYDANSEHAYDKLDIWIADTTHAMIRLSHDWQTTKQIGVSVNTLEALIYRGLIERQKIDFQYCYRRK